MLEQKFDIGRFTESNREEPLVSIIVPVYNTSAYPLRRCLVSLTNQKYQNLEIIIVDDGSTGSCFKNISDFAQMDNRITVLAGNHDGVSQARNKGIKFSHGIWISFVDSDDEVSTSFIEHSLSVALDSGADLICGRVQPIFSNTNKDVTEVFKSYFVTESSGEIKLLKQNMISPFRVEGYMGPDFTGRRISSGKLFRASIIKSMSYDEDIAICEDAVFNYEFINRCTSIAFSCECWYWYYQYQHSSLHSSNVDIWEKSINSIWKRFSSRNDFESVQTRIAYMSFLTIEKCPRERGTRKEIYDLLKKVKILQCYSRNAVRSFYISPWTKFMFFLCRNNLFIIAYYYWLAKFALSSLIKRHRLINDEDDSVSNSR